MLSKDRGGLGIKNLSIQNKSLLMKWLWRYISEERTLWKEVIVAKYGELNPGCTEAVTLLYGWGVWRTIRNLWSCMEENVILKVGNGNKFKFWKDGWIDQNPLSELFPNLFSISTNPESRVNECWCAHGWNLFRRLLNDWEVDRVALLLEKLEGTKLDTNVPDRIIWKHNQDGKFIVNSAYKQGIQGGPGNNNYQWKTIERGLIPTKVKCSTWLVIKRACFTQEVLQKKGRTLVPRCFLCNLTGETNSHLFMHCKIQLNSGNSFSTSTVTVGPCLSTQLTYIVAGSEEGGSKTQKRWWKMIPSCIWWSIWIERNGRCFEDKSNSIQKASKTCFWSYTMKNCEIATNYIPQPLFISHSRRFKAFALAFLKFKAFALQVLGLCLCGTACRIQLHHSVPQPQFCIFFCRIILLSLIVAPVILYFPFISPSVSSLGCWWGNQLEGIIIPCVSLSFFVFLEGFCFSS